MRPFSGTAGLRLRTKLLISYILLMILPVSFLSYSYFMSGRNTVSDLAARNAWQILRDKNEILDTRLSKIQESSLAIIKDRDLFEMINNMEKNGENILSADRTITRVINNYFPLLNYVYEVQIATSYYIFGNNFNMLTGDSYVRSDLYKTTVAADGRLTWIPTYDFLDMYGHENMKEGNFEVRNVFSAARLINSFFLDNGVFSVLENDVERPVLIIHFREDTVRDLFCDSIPIPGVVFSVMDRRGHIVSHSDPARVGQTENPPWLAEAAAKKSGITTIWSGGQQKIICYDTSSVTDWIATAEIPTNALTAGIIPSMLKSMATGAVIFLTLAMLLAVLISGRITRPVLQLSAAMKQMGHGNFSTRVPVSTRDEVGYLVTRFNAMNDRIGQLIEENYAVKLREKETEIMALNLQMNPHFLYNTLNIINWMAIEEGNKQISDMLINLCDMLVYTVRNKQDMVSFGDDLRWLRCYLYIMGVRFEHKFSVVWNVEDSLYGTQVPKLFLQPFVENAMLHGFENLETGGEIRISGKITPEGRCFSVSDNGKGMVLDGALPEAERDGRSSIGIANVDKRIRLLFGPEYGVRMHSAPGEGTTVEILLPPEPPEETIQGDSDVRPPL